MFCNDIWCYIYIYVLYFIINIWLSNLNNVGGYGFWLFWFFKLLNWKFVQILCIANNTYVIIIFCRCVVYGFGSCDSVTTFVKQVELKQNRVYSLENKYTVLLFKAPKWYRLGIFSRSHEKVLKLLIGSWCSATGVVRILYSVWNDR